MSMFKFGDDNKLVKCSFCGKNHQQVKKLIAGPGVYICDECIGLCNDIIEEELGKTIEKSFRFRGLPRPKDIHKVLDQYVIRQEQAKKGLSVDVDPVKSASVRLNDLFIGISANTWITSVIGTSLSFESLKHAVSQYVP